MIVPLEHVIILSIIIFSIGIMGVLFRKNAIIIFMSIELMLNAVNLSLVGFSRYYNSVDGQVFVFLVMTLAAAEVAVGLAIIVSLFRNKQTINLNLVWRLDIIIASTCHRWTKAPFWITGYNSISADLT